MTTHTHDAWIIGVHDLPADLPIQPATAVANLRMLGHESDYVIVHDLGMDRWESMSLEQFDAEYEFV